MAHPMAGQAQSSLKARLKRLGATAGKPWGYSSMYKKRSYPKKNAGMERPMTIEGGNAHRRADRMATGGAVKKKQKAHHTTNIVISAPGGGGGRGGGLGPVGGAGGIPRPPLPGAGAPPIAPPVVPPRPPLAVGAGAPMPVAGGMGAGAALPPRPPIAPPVGAGAMPMRPPGMKRGGEIIGSERGHATMQRTEEDAPRGKTYPGYPHSPTTAGDSAVSPHRRGGKVKRRANGGTVKRSGETEPESTSESGLPGSFGSGPPQAATAAAQNLSQSQAPASMAQTQKRGGKVKKRQMGGPAAAAAPTTMPGAAGLYARPGVTSPMPASAGRPATPMMVPTRPGAGSLRALPAPGTTAGFKRGGEAHGDEAADRKLFKKLLKQEKPKKRRRGGSVGHFSPTNQDSTDPGLANSGIYHQQGKGYQRGGYVDNAPMGPKMPGSAAGGLGRLAKTRMAKKVPDKTEA